MSRKYVLELKDINLSYQSRVIGNGRSWIKDAFSPIYERKRILEGLDFTVEGAGITSILGRNGAGKTTLLKVMTGILTPESGTIEVLGHAPSKRSRHFLREIGVVFGQKKMLWPEHSLDENLEMVRVLYGIEKSEFRNRVEEDIDTFDLRKLRSRAVKTLSLGQSMRAEILAALLPKPKVVFLDEPTIGLDLPAQKVIRASLAKTVEQTGCHVILTSHNLRDISELSTSIWFLEQGNVKPFDLSLSDCTSLEEELERRLLVSK
jgi:ABC-2 type transport system ATP-binding protein